jgi:hypothetical protein
MAIVILLMIVTNGVLWVQQNALHKMMGPFFVHTVDWQDVSYVFPQQFLIKNLTLAPDNAPEQPFVLVPWVEVNFSLTALFFQGKLRFSHIVFHHPQLRTLEDFPLLQKDITNIYERFRHAPPKKLRLVVQEASLGVSEDIQSTPLFDVQLDIHGESILAKGRTAAFGGISRHQGESLEFIFSLDSSQPNMRLVFLEVKGDPLYVNLWGSVNKDVLSFNGFSFLQSVEKKESRTNKSQSGFVRQMNGFLARYGPPQGLDDLSKIEHYILDINGRVRVLSNRIQVEHSEFVVDGIPVQMTGHFAMQPFQFTDVNIVTFPAYSKVAWARNIQKINAHVNGRLAQDQWQSQGRVQVAFSEQSAPYFSSQTLTVDFDDLNVDCSLPPSIGISLAQMKSSFNNTHDQLLIRDFYALIRPQSPQELLVEFSSPFYGGFLEGDIVMDTEPMPFKVSSSVRLKDADASSIEKIFMKTQTPNVDGRLHAEVSLQTLPKQEVQGALRLEEGTVAHAEILDWFSTYFAIPSLKKLDFEQFSLEFAWEGGKKHFSNIHLESPDVDMKGFFKVGNRNLVSSKFSLIFPRKIMEESDRLNPLLKRLDPYRDPLTFDFQLSGKLNRMNLLWNSSDLKTEIQHVVPRFMQRRIERKIAETL